jgi:Putative Ig domain
MAFVFARHVSSPQAASRLGKWLKLASGLVLFSTYTAMTTSCGLPAQSANLSSSTSASSKVRSFDFANHALDGHIRVSAGLPPGIVGTAYNAVVSVSGGTTPYQFSVVSGSLPVGLSLNPSADTISGTPVTAGTYKFTVRVVDAAGLSDEKRFTLSVAAATVAPAVSVQISPLSPTVSSGTAKQFTATVSNTSDTAVTWSATAGTISTSGVFSATDVSVASTATVMARSVADPTKAASTTVTIAVSNPVITPPSTGFDGPAELPRVYVQSAITDTPAPGNIVTVNAGGNLQNALNAANCGDTILLQAGATFGGFFTFPAKACDSSHWIIIRTSAPDSSLPPEGTRLTPCYAGIASLPGRPALNCSSTHNVLAKISMPAGGSGPLVFEPGANHYRLIGLELTRTVGTGIVYSLVSLKTGTTADHLIFDRMWLHGTPQDDTNKGIQFGGSTHVAVIDSFFTDFHCTAITGACTDSSAVGGGTGDNPMGPYKIVNNFLEASGENILFGGSAATLTPADIEIRHNHMFKPMTWKQGQPGYVGGPNGNPFIVKNLFELKNAQRVLLEGNIMENTWGGFSQKGFGILITPKNQSATTGGGVLCPLCQTTDVTLRYNTISHVAAGLQIANVLSDNGGAPLDGQRYSIHDLIIDDIDGATYGGPGIFAILMTDGTAPILQNVSINHVTAFPPKTAFSIGDTTAQKMVNFTFSNSLINAGQYPVWSTGGTANCAYWDTPLTTLNACFSPYLFTTNAIIASPAAYGVSIWPANNFFPADAAAVQFVNYNGGNGGDYHLLASSPYKNVGNDGKDLGADVDAVSTAIAGAQ